MTGELQDLRMTQLIFDIEDVQRVRGTELSFLLLDRSAEPADRRCDVQTDGQT